MSERPVERTKGQGSVRRDPPSTDRNISYRYGWWQAGETARAADHAKAAKTLQREPGDIAVGKSPGAGRTRIAALLQLLIEDYRSHDRADLGEAQQRVNRLLNPMFGEMGAAAFTAKALKGYIEFRQKRGMANATINRELALLRRAFRLGYEHDPQLVFRLPIIKALPEDNVREGFLEPDKYRLLLDALTEPIKPVFVIAYHLGIRTGELLGLRRSWVDLQEGLIYVNGRVTKNCEPKTAPVYGDMGPWLEMLLSRGQVDSPKCVWLFAKEGKPIKSFTADWENACKKAGVPELLFHDLRRTAVRNMIRAGVPEKVAMKISGHKTASMLWRYKIKHARDIKDAGKRAEKYLRAHCQSKEPTECSDGNPANWCPARDLIGRKDCQSTVVLHNHGQGGDCRDRPIQKYFDEQRLIESERPDQIKPN